MGVSAGQRDGARRCAARQISAAAVMRPRLTAMSTMGDVRVGVFGGRRCRLALGDDCEPATRKCQDDAGAKVGIGYREGNVDGPALLAAGPRAAP